MAIHNCTTQLCTQHPWCKAHRNIYNVPSQFLHGFQESAKNIKGKITFRKHIDVDSCQLVNMFWLIKLVTSFSKVSYTWWSNFRRCSKIASNMSLIYTCAFCLAELLICLREVYTLTNCIRTQTLESDCDHIWTWTHYIYTFKSLTLTNFNLRNVSNIFQKWSWHQNPLLCNPIYIFWRCFTCVKVTSRVGKSGDDTHPNPVHDWKTKLNPSRYSRAAASTHAQWICIFLVK